MRRWQYLTDEGLILGYFSIAGSLPAEELVTRLGKKRTTLLPKLYTLREEGRLQQTIVGKTRPYELTDRGRRDVERYHLADGVRAYLNDSTLTAPIKEASRRPLEAVRRVETPLEQVAPILTVGSRFLRIPKHKRKRAEPKK